MAYINTSLLMTSVEERNGGRLEINSVCELLSGLITGEYNDIDEDGDFPGSHDTVKIVRTFISRQFPDILFRTFPAETGKTLFRISEISSQPVQRQTDHPPQSRLL
jgi:hypothetical protein